MVQVWRAAAIASALTAYALLSHWLMVHAANDPLTLALLFGPLILAVAGLSWRRRDVLALSACAALLVLLVAVVLQGGVQDAQRMYVLQHGGIHLALAWTFGLSLRAPHTPLITVIARGVHRRLGQTFSPTMAVYTRRLTRVWVGYFVGMTVLSVLLYALAPWPWWSLFCTVLTPLAVVAVFVGEYLWRYWMHPEFPRVSMRVAVDAYRRSRTEEVS